MLKNKSAFIIWFIIKNEIPIAVPFPGKVIAVANKAIASINNDPVSANKVFRRVKLFFLERHSLEENCYLKLKKLTG